MHMKRYSMPGFWPMGKKVEKFVVTPMPGPHAKRSSIPLLIILRDVLRFARNAKEASLILNKGEVLIDKRPVKDGKHPAGLMDIVEFPTIKRQFRVVAGTKGMALLEIPAKESSSKLCSIKGKNAIKGGKFQITLHDGRCILVGKENKYKPGDSLLIEVPGQKILSHWQMKAGVPAMIVSGKNMGVSGKIKDVHARRKMQEKSRVVLLTKSGEIETLKDYVLVGEVK
ncbi:MAG: 30S ribosomal protein S4e [Candidatus Aenigmarchaeota archaeon]|nr:30S ribosomal protein S4e [Candidatus Aenigmarchaeota archaeon]